MRRKKGLSLSEVARGAGLSRRELVAYERGKVPIPESDLWVLAGSCGVDVAELVPSTDVDGAGARRRSPRRASVTPSPSSAATTRIRASRRTSARSHKLQALPPGKRIPVKDRELDAIAVALGGTPASVEQKLQDVLHVSPDEAQRLRAMIVAPPGGRGKPKAIAAASAPVPEPTPAPAPPRGADVPRGAGDPDADAVAPPTYEEPVQTLPVAPAPFLDTPLEAGAGHNVDVFAELARLPEPLPLGDPAGPVPDLLAPPTGTFSDDTFAASPFAPANVGAPPEAAVELVDSAPGALTTPTAFGLAADAPPIDVAMRQGSDRWDFGAPPLTPRAPETEPAWETNGWQPPEPPGAETGGPVAFWEGTDDWTPTEDDPATPEAHVDDDARGGRDRDRGRDRGRDRRDPGADAVGVRLGARTVGAGGAGRGPRRHRPVDRRRVAARARGRRRPVGARARPGGREHRVLRRLGHGRDRAGAAGSSGDAGTGVGRRAAAGVGRRDPLETAEAPTTDVDTDTDADTPLDVEEPEPQPVWDTATRWRPSRPTDRHRHRRRHAGGRRGRPSRSPSGTPCDTLDTVETIEETDTDTDADMPVDVDGRPSRSQSGTP